MLQKLRDPVSSLTHLAGAILAIPLTIVLIAEAVRHASARHIVAFAVFGASLFLLYTASAIYHMPRFSEKAIRVLRRIDHMMIFVLIAGTYTPVCLLPLQGVWGWTLFGLVWGLAAAGIVLKAVWMQAPRWLSTAIYVCMGWLVLIAFYPLVQTISTTAVMLLAGGGLVYTAGAVMYAVKWPPLRWRHFGFHELFHVFVLGGSSLHAAFMFQLIPT
jgi:hemolysin III